MGLSEVKMKIILRYWDEKVWVDKEVNVKGLSVSGLCEKLGVPVLQVKDETGSRNITQGEFEENTIYVVPYCGMRDYDSLVSEQ